MRRKTQGPHPYLAASAYNQEVEVAGSASLIPAQIWGASAVYWTQNYPAYSQMPLQANNLHLLTAPVVPRGIAAGVDGIQPPRASTRQSDIPYIGLKAPVPTWYVQTTAGGKANKVPKVPGAK